MSVSPVPFGASRSSAHAIAARAMVAGHIRVASGHTIGLVLGTVSVIQLAPRTVDSTVQLPGIVMERICGEGAGMGGPGRG